uniref:Uncharacterized protein n=1 Tax=Meloidogyne enterolobii TaxID=390850 RepID=A0A6V7XBX4_MELEN|nr:unnamed protein product [Meloidogyne enterolobii]
MEYDKKNKDEQIKNLTGELAALKVLVDHVVFLLVVMYVQVLGPVLVLLLLLSMGLVSALWQVQAVLRSEE